MPDVLRRHDLLRVHPHSWAEALPAHAALAGLPYLESWARNGWPVIVRRCILGDEPGLVPVAVALPPAAWTRRAALQIAPQHIAAREDPVFLTEAFEVAPAVWRTTLESVVSIGERFGARPCVFGGLLWQYRTGLQYLGAASDLDLLWRVTHVDQAHALARELAVTAARAPTRLDGEFILPDGGAINWRELAGDSRELLVKTMNGVALRSRARLFDPGCAVA